MAKSKKDPELAGAALVKDPEPQSVLHIEADPEDPLMDDDGLDMIFERDLIAALASNSEVYEGTAADAAKIVRLARQIMAEMTDL